MNIIQHGAEGILYLENNILVKERILKRYRHPKIDIDKRKSSTRNESKLLEKSSKLIPVPRVIFVDNKEMKIRMEFIQGKLVKNIFEDLSQENLRQIGGQVAILHNHNIIHGDLTTSNMIFKDNIIYFIDFGLEIISTKIEDKAVDLHLLKQVLNAKHYQIAKKAFESILEGYKNKSNNYKEIINRFKKVELRGRYKRRNSPVV